jgi:predicted MFS family arabinose efflux permease
MRAFASEHRTKGGPRATTRLDANVALWVLLAISVFNQLDRKLLAILQVPITAELHLRDWHLGALTGLSFAAVYSLLALPMARVADGLSRKWLMAAALVLWSLMTAASGLATNFLMLVICRMGLALGESACTPATLSMLADYFPPRKRATAIAIWTLATPIGLMLGSAAGGWLASSLGWRHAFIYVGLAGLVFLLPLLLLREPPRGQHDDLAAPVPKPPPLFVTLRLMWASRALRCIILGAACQTFVLNALVSWSAPFYARAYEMPLTQIGLALAVIFGLGGGAGSLLGGIFGGALSRRDPRGYAWVTMGAMALLVPACWIQLLTPNLELSLAAGFLGALLMHVYLAPTNASLQSLAQPNTRAFASAITIVFTGLAGGGLGPLVAGALSDVLRDAGAGDASIAYALCIIAPVSWIGVAIWWRASRHMVVEMPAAAASLGRTPETANGPA